MSQAPRFRTVLSCSLLLASLGAGVAACGGPDSSPLSSTPFDAAGQISFSGPKGSGKAADPNKPLEVTIKNGSGRITDVTATDATGRQLAGELSADGSRWHSTASLAAGAHYTVRVSTEDGRGQPGTRMFRFDTKSSSNRLNATFGPEKGVYGVGQPITAQLSAPVKAKADRAKVERALKVTSVPAADGAWYWVDSKTLHFRPKEYWPAHATIKVRSNLNGIKIAGKLYGGDAKPLTITTGDRLEALANAGSDQMVVKRNGKVINTIPITMGKPGFSTRNGVKVVLGKTRYVRMTSSSIGIAAGSSDSYDLPVYFATQVTWSGEYVHAAPWSVGSQGYANTSHGCTGMSMDNATWFFNHFRKGDIVNVTGSEGATMTPFDNGFGDWNLSWDKWRKGSALSAGKQADSTPAETARLQPAAF
ncbi:L,D-transpeptidase [Streptomyces sp. NBC_00344]|uniref:L,D-transpeptidase n=1 Tax=Streptomyces sp. NBC_00344 TaxID=2975720 RepID=UPI002E1ABD8C